MCCEKTFSDSGVVRGVVLSAHIQVSDRAPSEVQKCQFRPGQDLRGGQANWAVAQGLHN